MTDIKVLTDSVNYVFPFSISFIPWQREDTFFNVTQRGQGELTLSLSSSAHKVGCLGCCHRNNMTGWCAMVI